MAIMIGSGASETVAPAECFESYDLVDNGVGYDVCVGGSGRWKRDRGRRREAHRGRERKRHGDLGQASDLPRIWEGQNARVRQPTRASRTSSGVSVSGAGVIHRECCERLPHLPQAEQRVVLLGQVLCDPPSMQKLVPDLRPEQENRIQHVGCLVTNSGSGRRR